MSRRQISFSAVQSTRTLELGHKVKIVPTLEDLKVTRLVVVVHGIGTPFRYSTVQAVARRFAAYCRRPITQPLGAFHPAKLITKPDSPELGAYVFEPPKEFEKDFSGFGFAEVFWADIPERAAATKNTTEESKAWAQTIVERVRLLDELGSGKSDLIDYRKASAVVEEMIGTVKVLENILFIASKAGLFEFNLGQLLTDFIGCVQIVADFKDYGGDVFKRFADTMKNLVRRMPNIKEIYIVAHSEGTVVSLKAILTALSAQKNRNNEWVNKVNGFMTIGSPLNKHIVMWPKLWQDLKPAPSRTGRDPILWRNYYDFGDPVGFDLQITRDWMADNGWLSKDETKEGARFFQFREDHDDYGFTRYPFPGKAHNDYWNDDTVFGHFINEVILKKENGEKPRTIWWTKIMSWVVPYILCFALVAGGTYVLYNTVVATFFESQGFPILRDVFGITCLLAGVTVLSRMPRLDKIQWSSSIGALAFALGVIGYLTSVSFAAKQLLSSAFLMPIPDVIIWWFLASGLVSAGLSKWKPRWGMFPLIGLGGVAAGFVLLKLFQQQPNKLGPSFWALFLANAAFLYLWWLAGSLFDLVYIWHRFICTFKTTSVLSKLRKEAPKQLQA
jgi:hypothetical protein